VKGKGPRHERETVILFNEEDSVVNIWTASESVYRQLKKRGYFPTEDNDRSASFEVPKQDIKLPRPKSEKRSQIARRRAEALGNALFSSGARSRAMDQPPNPSAKGQGKG